MAAERNNDKRFGIVALEMNFIDQDHLDKALVVQTRIFDKTRVKMPIGEVLIEMGAMTPVQRDEILRLQDEIVGQALPEATSGMSPKKRKSTRQATSRDSTLEINVSKDKLSAMAHIDGQVPAREFDVGDVKLMLHSDDILYGIADDANIQAFLNGEFGFGKSWAIATGIPSVPESPPQIVYHFDTDPMKIGTLTEAGFMDWKDRGQLPQVNEGDLLAEKIPGPAGKEGMDVHGTKIPIPKVRERRLKCGKGARRSADGLQIHAKLSGMPKLSITGEISVMPTLHIQGDISLETGHVEFDGHVEVSGAVEKGYQVKGGSLRANEIRDAQVDVDGDITATNGIFGATIRSNGNLKAGHVHNTEIILAGDMAVEKEIIESTIEANGRCLIHDGIIIASTISARMGIVAMDIGTEASKSSELFVGVDRQLEREAEAVKGEIQAIKADQEKLPKLIENLKKQSDQVNTRLGDVAQKQDKCMVRHRRLEEKIEAGMLNQGNATAKHLQKKITELKAKQDAYDEDVAQLMEEDESIGRQIAATQKTITENATAIDELNQRQELITEAQKTGSGVAMVKVGGNVYAGTKVSGQHSARVLEEDLKRLTLAETNKPDHEGAKHWRIELNPFR